MYSPAEPIRSSSSVSDPLPQSDVLPLSFFSHTQQKEKKQRKHCSEFPPHRDLYCQFCGLSTSYLPFTSPTVANHRGGQLSVPPLSPGTLTSSQVRLCNRHQMFFLMEGKADRRFTPSWLFPFLTGSERLRSTHDRVCAAQRSRCVRVNCSEL